MWSGLIAVFIFAILLVVILGGILKSFIPSKVSTGGSWNADSSLAVAINTNPPAIIIYAKEPAKLGVFSLSSDLKFVTGDADNPVRSVGSLFGGPGKKAEAVLSNLNGVNVSRFIYFKNPPKLERTEVYEMFKEFSSIKTPISILLGKTTFSTDLSKMELLKLWWQVKGLTVAQIDFNSVANFSEEIIGANNKKFKGINRESVNHEMAKYFDGEARGDIEILNGSGEPGAGALAADMYGAYGWNVVNVSTSPNVEPSCSVTASDVARDIALLAGIFGCNIIREQTGASGNPVITLGSDFAKRYF